MNLCQCNKEHIIKKIKEEKINKIKENKNFKCTYAETPCLLVVQAPTEGNCSQEYFKNNNNKEFNIKKLKEEGINK